MSVLGIFAFSFAAATLLYVMILPFWASVTLFVLVLLGGSLLFMIPKAKRLRLRLAAVGLAFGLLWCCIYEHWQIRPLEELTGTGVKICLTAIEDEEKTDYGSKVLCKSGNVRVFAYIYDCKSPIYAGDQIILEGNVEAATLEDGMSYIAKDVDMTVRQDGTAIVNAGEKTFGNLPARLYGNVRRRIVELFPKDTAPFALALLTGDTGQLSYGFRNQMSLAGISHVVAVSGMHVSLICSLVLNLCLRRRRLAAGFCLGAMWFFGAMLGFSPSVTRAVVMNSIVLLAPILNREYDSPTALGFALLLLLLKNPFSIASPGLQLSFGAVGGILMATMPLCQAVRERTPQWIRKRRILWGGWSFLTTSVATTLGASLITVPLAAYYFGTVSLISFVSNLILLPLISFIFTLGYPLLALSYCFYPVAQTVAEYMSIPIRWVIRGVECLARVPYGAFYTRSVYVVLWLIAAYGLIAVAVIFKKRVLPFVLVLLMLITVPFLQKIHPEDLRFTMLDVGQGQCLMAEVGESVVVIDCGGTQGEASGEEAARELLSRDHRNVHGLILTHYDLDHSGGVLQFMDRINVGCLYLPDISPENAQREKIEEKAAEQQVPIIWVKEKLHLRLDGGSLDIFPPVGTKSKNDGLSLLLSAVDYDILVTGDLPIEEERTLICSHPLPDLEILVAGHHGAANSTGQELLEHTMPEELLISVGQNSYGHPALQVLERAQNVGIRIRRTDQEGTIIITR